MDGYEFKQVTESLSNFVTQEQLYFASRIGCAREVYEETGMDFRQRLHKFLPMILYSSSTERNLINEYKNRIFFVCEVDDGDFPKAVSWIWFLSARIFFSLHKLLHIEEIC